MDQAKKTSPHLLKRLKAMERHPTDLLSPRSVAVIGASEDLTKSIGRLLKLLVRDGYDRAIHPINCKRKNLLGIKTCASIDQTPRPPDMTVPRDVEKRPCWPASRRAPKRRLSLRQISRMQE